MSAPSIQLVQNGKARRLTGAEIHALTAERLAQIKVERERRQEEFDSWRRGQAAEARRAVRTKRLFAVLLFAVAVWGSTPGGSVVVGLFAAFCLLGWAAYSWAGRRA